ncbi:hypothetical protein E2C01_081294 [Portunus trituberculatus]|uniref:Uncharacterized protein n=1 Tax=Portunus trituberculatus TaxID=210409 RepID=A0A5B7IVF6_PORTR|nr:hypothetical protein [Portunus trituberculatus]
MSSQPSQSFLSLSMTSPDPISTTLAYSLPRLNLPICLSCPSQILPASHSVPSLSPSLSPPPSRPTP